MKMTMDKRPCDEDQEFVSYTEVHESISGSEGLMTEGLSTESGCDSKNNKEIEKQSVIVSLPEPVNDAKNSKCNEKQNEEASPPEQKDKTDETSNEPEQDQEFVSYTEVHELISGSEGLMTEGLSTEPGCDSKNNKETEKQSGIVSLPEPVNDAKNSKCNEKQNEEASPPEQKDKTDETSNETKQKSNFVQFLMGTGRFFVGLAQIVIAIATLYNVWLVNETLIEMQTERNNAYRPEIVIMPNIFEGGLVKKEEHEIEKSNIYFDYDLSELGVCYSNYPSKTTCFYLEKPFLTLKNIGQGTAKNLKVTFSITWLEKVVDSLNEDYGTYFHDDSSIDNMEDAYYYLSNFRGDEDVDITLFIQKPTGLSFYPLSSEDETIKNITHIAYIASGDDSINVVIPEGWDKLLSVLLIQSLRTDKDKTSFRADIKIPELLITIEYADMQGNSYEQEETIPWTFYYSGSKTYPNKEIESMYLRMGIYEDYIR